MFDFYVLTEKILMFVLLLIPGYILSKCKLLGDKAIPGLTEIITKIAMPCLVIVKMLETDISKLGVANVIFCIIHVPVMLFLLYILTGLVFKKRRVERFCSVFPNCGFLGIPLAAAMFPDQPEVAVFVAIWNIFNSVMVLTFGVNILSPVQKKSGILSIILKPISISAVVGIVLSVLHVGEKVPSLIAYTGYFADLTTPLSMTILGYELSKLKPGDIFLRRELYTTSIMKMCISPLLAFVMVYLVMLIPGVELSMPLAAAIFIATGVPTAAIASALSRDAGQDSGLAAILTVGTTILSVVFLPLMSLVFELMF